MSRLPLMPELLLDLDLDGKPVRVPSRLASDVESLHGAMAAEEILDRAREHVMDARAPVRRGRTLEEHELLIAARERLRDEILGLPAREHLLLERVRRELRREQRVARGRRGAVIVRSSTPRTSAVRCGSARPAISTISASVTGSQRIGQALIRHDREPEHAHPAMHRRDHLGHRGHSHRVGADRAQHAVLRARLERGAA